MSTHITEDYKAFLIAGEYTVNQLQQILRAIQNKQGSDKQARYFEMIGTIPQGCFTKDCDSCYKTVGYILPNGETEYFKEDFCECGSYR